MADSKLSALAELATQPADTDELYINDGGVSKKITAINLIPAATTSLAGKVELATSAETITGTDAARAVTPDGLSARLYNTRTITGTSDTPTIDDAEALLITSNAAAVAISIPANASVAYEVGTSISFYQSGAGQITVSVTTDTLRSPNGAKTAAQYTMITATKVGTTEWVITGDSTT